MNTVCASVNHVMMGIFNLSGEIRCIFESDDQWWRPNIGIDHHQIAHIIIWLISNLSKFVTIYNSSNKSIRQLRTNTHSVLPVGGTKKFFGKNWIWELISVCQLLNPLNPFNSIEFTGWHSKYPKEYPDPRRTLKGTLRVTSGGL